MAVQELEAKMRTQLFGPLRRDKSVYATRNTGLAIGVYPGNDGYRRELDVDDSGEPSQLLCPSPTWWCTNTPPKDASLGVLGGYYWPELLQETPGTKRAAVLADKISTYYMSSRFDLRQSEPPQLPYHLLSRLRLALTLPPPP